ncbi:unnamed protein product [Eruca vesicaria subsp. sativa]|uniref:F-box domain-containing protein n=1 Tax=Eruca vesicaria subsp. sativa TaxID=29727 RepID=A0ABC8L618_ERUVS|nr:unnamed protein product [Eruca vesicaria subsp. sativa]
MSTQAASNFEKLPQEDNYEPPPSLSSLPDDVVLNCLSRVPRCDDLNISCVSKTLRSLVRSPELCRLRSLLPKKSVYLFYSFLRQDPKKCHWITLRRGEKTTTTHDYQVEHSSCSSSGTPPRFSRFCSSAVSVGSDIYFPCPPKKLWILDTRSGTIRMGPSMKVARWVHKKSMGVVDGKIYVIGGLDVETQVEVFDPKTQTWEFAGEEKLRCESQFSASLEDKVYMVQFNYGGISAYSPEKGISNEATGSLSDKINCVCVVENVIYACVKWRWLMWFDTKLKVWRRLIDSDGKVTFCIFNVEEMAEYEGKLAVFWTHINNDGVLKTEIRCNMIALDRVGEEIRGMIESSGIVATYPHTIFLSQCVAVSD